MRLKTVPAVLVLALALASCGSDGGSDESAVGTDDRPTTTQRPESGSGRDAGTGGSGGAGESSDCRAMREAVEGTSSEVGQAMSGDADAFAESIERLEAMADQAPEEIRDDLRTLREAYGELAQTLADAELSPGKTPSGEALRKLQEIGESFDTAELERASTNVTEWFEENCGR